MTLKIKDKKLFRKFYLTRKFELQVFFVNKGSGSGIFPDPDPGDPKRPDPTGSGSATLLPSMTLGAHHKFIPCLFWQKKLKM